MASCAPNGAAHQNPNAVPWWRFEKVTKVFLSRMNQVGSPWLKRSVVSGRSRQISRRRWRRAGSSMSRVYVTTLRTGPVLAGDSFTVWFALDEAGPVVHPFHLA